MDSPSPLEPRIRAMLRHSQIVPACLIAQLKRSVKVSPHVALSPLELLVDPRACAMTPATKSMVRSALITRMRSRSNNWLDWTPGVALHEDWQSALRGREGAVYIRHIESTGDRWMHMSLREIKLVVHEPISRILSVLARIEACDPDKLWYERSDPQGGLNKDLSLRIEKACEQARDEAMSTDWGATINTPRGTSSTSIGVEHPITITRVSWTA